MMVFGADLCHCGVCVACVYVCVCVVRVCAIRVYVVLECCIFRECESNRNNIYVEIYISLYRF